MPLLNREVMALPGSSSLVSSFLFLFFFLLCETSTLSSSTIVTSSSSFSSSAISSSEWTSPRSFVTEKDKRRKRLQFLKLQTSKYRRIRALKLDSIGLTVLQLERLVRLKNSLFFGFIHMPFIVASYWWFFTELRIRDVYPGSWIPEPKVKKAPDPGSGSATKYLIILN